MPSHKSAPSIAGILLAMTGHSLASSALMARKHSCPAGTSISGKIAFTGHSATHKVQSMHSSGSITRKFGPSWKQSTGHTSTQSVYLQLMQLSVTTWVMAEAGDDGISLSRHRSSLALMRVIDAG